MYTHSDFYSLRYAASRCGGPHCNYIRYCIAEACVSLSPHEFERGQCARKGDVRTHTLWHTYRAHSHHHSGVSGFLRPQGSSCSPCWRWAQVLRMLGLRAAWRISNQLDTWARSAQCFVANRSASQDPIIFKVSRHQEKRGAANPDPGKFAPNDKGKITRLGRSSLR